MNGQLSMGGLARATGVGVETIRYYERIGLMTAPPRTAGGHRAYEDVHLRRLTFIRRGRELGFSLDDIRELLGVADQTGPVCVPVLQVAEPHLENVRRKIADLKRLEAMLDQALSACTGNLPAPDCPFLALLADEAPAGAEVAVQS